MTQKTHCQWGFKITSSDNGRRVIGMQDIAILGDIFKIADVFVVLAPRPTVYKCCGWMFRSSFGGRRPEAKREECSWRRLWLGDTVLAITKWHSDGSVLEVSGTVKQCKIWAAWHVNFFCITGPCESTGYGRPSPCLHIHSLGTRFETWWHRQSQ